MRHMKHHVYIYMFSDGSITTSSMEFALKPSPRLAPMHGAQRVFHIRAQDGRVVVLKDRLDVFKEGQVLDEIPSLKMPSDGG